MILNDNFKYVFHFWPSSHLSVFRLHLVISTIQIPIINGIGVIINLPFFIYVLHIIFYCICIYILHLFYVCLFFQYHYPYFLCGWRVMVYCRVTPEARCSRASLALSWKGFDSTAVSVPTVVSRFASHWCSMFHFIHFLF